MMITIPFRIARLSLALSLLFIGGPLLLQAQDETALDKARVAFGNQDYLVAARYYKDALKTSPGDKLILVETGDTYMALEFYDTAVSYYRQAYDKDSKGGEINRKLGTALSLLGERDEAIEKLRRAFKFEDKSLESRLALAKGLLRAGPDSMSQAELLILNTDDEFPNTAEVKTALGDLYFGRRVYELAETYYTQAIELDESLVEPRVQLGETYISRAGRDASTQEEYNQYYLKALEQFNTVTKLDPKNAPAWRRQAEIFALAGKHGEAIGSYGEYVKLRPDDPRGPLALAELWAAANNPAQAMGPAREVLRNTDEASRAFAPKAQLLIARGYYLYGQLASNNGNMDSARRMYTEAARAYDVVVDSVRDANDYIYHGTAMMWMGDTARGIELWKRVADAFPDSCNLSFTIASGLFSMQRYNDAIDLLNRRMANCPEGQGNAYLVIGTSYLAQERGDEAAAAFSKMIESDSTNIDGYYWLMNTLAATKQTGGIPAIFEAMRRNVPADSDPEKMATSYYFNGVAAFDAKEFKDAIANFEQAVELKPDYARAYLHMAVSYHTLKDKANACANYRKALQYDPGNSVAETNLKKLGC